MTRQSETSMAICCQKSLRSQIMRSVKSHGNKSTEIRLRAALAAKGLRGWKVQPNNLPGRPDFTFPLCKVAIFVDGCFWHGCKVCYRRPNSAQEYWDNKVKRNISRDLKVSAQLSLMGWQVIRIWEHEIQASLDDIVNKINQFTKRVVS